jgi:predicted DCC family thiol-disulfide oxidoreductase YuxK
LRFSNFIRDNLTIGSSEDISGKTILFFDGLCGLCSRSVKFVLKKEKKDELFFSPLQSEFAKQKLKELHVSGNTETMVLLENNKIYFRSTAALRTTKYLKGLWPLMMGFLIVPKFIRDAVYSYIAKNRITWFGSADYCGMITPELKKRFLE